MDFCFLLAPSGPPQDIKHRSPEDGQLTITWNLPACGQRRGNIVKYEYQYWLQFKQDEITNGSTTNREIDFSGLMSNATFLFQVRAYTTEGPGPYSAPYEAMATGSSPGKSVKGIIMHHVFPTEHQYVLDTC